MQEITNLLTNHGLALVFLNVFLVQAGAPVPAVPTLMLAGALAVSGGMSLPAIVAVATLASLLGDLIWYCLGRIYGVRVLQFFCRVSLSPDSCVRDTEDRFVRWGAPSLVIAKFIPGFAAVAPPLAGATRIGVAPFLAYSALSAVLWSGVAAGAGMMFAPQIEWLMSVLEQLGGYALLMVAGVLALYVAVKWWQRRRFFKALRMARISVEDLYQLIRDGHNPVIVDVRSTGARALDPRGIPGAVKVDIDGSDEVLSQLPAERDIILFCS